jgi:hypothetical protein
MGEEPPATSTTTLGDVDAPAVALPDRCSASNLSGVPSAQAGLQVAVAARREAVVAAAVRCDYVALAALAAPEFTFSFGNGGDPAAFWRGAEDAGGDPMRRLVLTLELPSTLDTRFDPPEYIWPSASAYDSWEQIPDEQRQALLALYDAEEIALFEEFGGFIGERVGITTDGEWLFFVGGD